MPAWWNGRHKRLKISGLNKPCQFESGLGYLIFSAGVAFKVKHTWLILRKRELKRGQRNSLGLETCVFGICEKEDRFGENDEGT